MKIQVQGAREHNLQDIDVELKDGLTVVTGVSGSGKTSLVFDTIYHEARRRFLEVFSVGSSAARMAPAEVQAITGLGPAIAVGQNQLNRNPLSTLATASGLHPFFRLLYARFGTRYCPRCGHELVILGEDEIAQKLSSLTKEGPVEVFAVLTRGVRGSHRALFSALRTLVSEFGLDSLWVDGSPRDPGEHGGPRAPGLDPVLEHDIEVRVAQLDSNAPQARRPIEAARALGARAVVVRPDRLRGQWEKLFSWAPVCARCDTWFGDLQPVHMHRPCPFCSGEGCERCGDSGLHPLAARVRWLGLRLPELLAHSVDHARSLFDGGDLPPSAARLRLEIERRLTALQRVGLGYVALDRPSPSLSRGEAQRARLAVALTSRLEDMLHILDEPTIGQHPADVARLMPVFRDLPGPVVYVEHDRAAAAAADHAIDLGPGAGNQGGRLLFTGTPEGLWQADTPTGHHFSLGRRVSIPHHRPCAQRHMVVRDAHLRNLQGIDVEIPLGRLSVVTGVSGSGKSTLVVDVLVATLAQGSPVGCRAIEGPSLKPVLVDQTPIGKNPRSNPATYTKLADTIRECFAQATGLSASHFSFNRPEGACPTCKGMGAVEVSMRYLPSTWVRCSDCEGQRFSDEVLDARVSFGEHALSIADFCRLSISEVAHLLGGCRLDRAKQESALRILNALCDVGLGYLSLGQPSPTLSGGEAQRVKLAKYLGQRSLSSKLLVLDEPSTGLHPQDIAGLLAVLDRLVRAGATVVVVEHNTDVIRAADWAIDLGPGSGSEGGRLLYAGPAEKLPQAVGSETAKALRAEDRICPRVERAVGQSAPSGRLVVKDARANNLRGIDVTFEKRALTVVTGVSGSGKSSLVHDVLESEARRRHLESLSLYERQSTREGPEAAVGSVTGLGVAITLDPDKRLHDRRATVGTATEIHHHLAVLLSQLGERDCPDCGAPMRRLSEGSRRDGGERACPSCQKRVPVARPRHFSPRVYAAACHTCNGVGTLRKPNPKKLIVHPERPLCGGAMHSPGFFPKGYLCKPFNGGYDMVQALAGRYAFDPQTTPWQEMTPDAQRAFLFGDPEPLPVTYRSRSGRTRTTRQRFPGFYGWVRDWDVGGTYTDTQICPGCGGARLRPEYLAVRLCGYNAHELSEMPLWSLHGVSRDTTLTERIEREPVLAGASLRIVQRRLGFLLQVGLGYLHLNRPSSTLSAGEAQRVKLAGLLGSGLTSLAVLLDEPTRGLHPSEVSALADALRALRDEGNTVIVVEHDPLLIRAADYVLDLGPRAGVAGGEIVAQGEPRQVARADTLTGLWLRGEGRMHLPQRRREARGWLVLRGARANNLRGDDVRLPLEMLTGVCGVSGSGKSSLVVETLGRALAPKKQTTSVAYEPIEPGPYEAIEGAPRRTVVVDQAKAGVRSPADYLGLSRPLRALFAASEDAMSLGVDEEQLARRCSSCKGSGTIRTEMGFLPDIREPCDTCQGTGYVAEAWQVRLKGVCLPELYRLTIDQVYCLFSEHERIGLTLSTAREVGLGYLVLRQPGTALSGGEAQRLKIARELRGKNPKGTLYILDEPTVGQHMEDVARLTGVLHRLVDRGGTVLVVEHHPHLLASCDWLVELGPGGGPSGGQVIATGSPARVAGMDTPTAPYLREALEQCAVSAARGSVRRSGRGG